MPACWWTPICHTAASRQVPTAELAIRLGRLPFLMYAYAPPAARVAETHECQSRMSRTSVPGSISCISGNLPRWRSGSTSCPSGRTCMHRRLQHKTLHLADTDRSNLQESADSHCAPPLPLYTSHARSDCKPKPLTLSYDAGCTCQSVRDAQKSKPESTHIWIVAVDATLPILRCWPHAG